MKFIIPRDKDIDLTVLFNLKILYLKFYFQCKLNNLLLFIKSFIKLKIIN
jgi:hypothetical protein